jgi:hypothetical protein
MKINEYAANVSEYTEVVDAPYNHKGPEQELDERPMGFIKGGLQKLGAKLLPGSYGAKMQGKVETGQQANQLYKEFHTFLGRSGYESTDDAIKAFLKQKGINVDIDSIIKQVAPQAGPSPAPAPDPVTESIDQLNRILILSGRSPKNIINETKTIKKKKVLTEAVTLNRGALNKVFMQVAQQMSGGAADGPTGGGPAPSGNPPAPPSGSPPAPPSGNPPAPPSKRTKRKRTTTPPSGSPPAPPSGSPPPAPPSGSPPAPPRKRDRKAEAARRAARLAAQGGQQGSSGAPTGGPQGPVADKLTGIQQSLGQGKGFKVNLPRPGDQPPPAPPKRKRRAPPPPPTNEDIQLERLLSKISMRF